MWSVLILLNGRAGWALAKQNQELEDMGVAVEKAAAAAAAAGSSAAAGRYVFGACAATQVVLQTATCRVKLHAAGAPLTWPAGAVPGAAVATGI